LLPVSPPIEITESRRVNNKTYRKDLRHRGDSFTLRKITAEESDLKFWNLLALIDPKYPQLPAKNCPAAKRQECASIALDFRSEEEASRFEDHFKYIVGQRMEHIKQFDKARKVAHAQSNKPTRRSIIASNASLRTSTSTLTAQQPSGISTAPNLTQIRELTSLEKDMDFISTAANKAPGT
jgi:hypothetical protein